MTLLRRHWLIAVLLAAGVALRILAQLAYHPALIYADTLKYLYGAYPGSEPLGYTAALRLVLVAGGLGLVVLLQHLLGLAMAVMLYVVLLRRGAPPWLSALAAAPVLLDAYQLQIEQMIMPETLFEAMIVAGLAILLWRPAVGIRFAIAGGFLLGSAATVKQLGLMLFVPAVIFVLVSAGNWRRSVAMSGALVAAFSLPVLGYCTYSYARTGHFWLAHRQPVTGRLTAAADCATLKLPAAVRPLCPTPAQQARGPDWLEHSAQSPLFKTPVQPGTRALLISRLNSAVAHQQPLRVAVAIVADWGRLFVPARTLVSSATPISRWQFQTGYPTFPPWVKVNKAHEIVVGSQFRVGGPFYQSVLKPAYGGRAQVDRPIASFLRSYQLDGGYTPGPLLALCALAGLGASVIAVARWRRPGSSRVTAAVLLFTATAATLLLLPDVYEFTWRYQLPALITLPPAGALAVGALIARMPARLPAGDPESVSGPGPGVVTQASGEGQREPDGLEDVLGRSGTGANASGESPGELPRAAAFAPSRHRGAQAGEPGADTSLRAGPAAPLPRHRRDTMAAPWSTSIVKRTAKMDSLTG
ncbi:MAG: hypothetical protein LBV34_05505 [Nocardiopsaceae bacterium]|nr:hypothetical protein [Nocardiopsaceae bacterium]